MIDTVSRPHPLDEPHLDAGAILNAVARPVFVVGDDGRFVYANAAAEQFLGLSVSVLRTRSLNDVLPDDSAIVSLVRQVARSGQGVSEFDVAIETPRIGRHTVSIDVSPIAEAPGCLAVSLQERSIASRIEHQLVHRNAARSVAAMAAILAHEVKNPLSGIRGAAQLLESVVDTADRELTRLICEEADRIVALVDRMEMFSDRRPITRTAVNIHEVLGHVRRIAEHGFARHVRFQEVYDPSLPPVLGNRDLLIQVLLNLVKNAAEANPEEEAEIHLSTRYQHGMRLAVPGAESRIDLPLQVIVQDNGPGIPEDMLSHLFEPFVSGKPNGKGLGLALVAKLVDAHGGAIECESEPRRTIFRLMLPQARDSDRQGADR